VHHGRLPLSLVPPAAGLPGRIPRRAGCQSLSMLS
jgi:hypothetical protein